MKDRKIWRLVGLFLIFKIVLLLFVWTCSDLIPFSQYDYDNNSDHFYGQEQSDLELRLSPYDGPQYLNIAYYGYEKMAKEDPKIYAFFPLYPFLIRIFSPLTANNYTVAGLLISFVCHFLGVIYFYRLILLDSDEKTARNSVKYFLIYPTAIFFLAVYTEALFFLLSILVFYLIRKRNWWLAGLFGLLGAISRPPGILLLVPFVIEYLIYLKEIRIQGLLDFFKKSRANFLSAALIPAGLLAYFYYVYLTTGDLFFYFKALDYWGRNNISFLNVPRTVYDHLANFNQLNLHSFHSSQIDVVFGLFFLLLVPLMLKYLRFSYWIYAFLLLALPLSSNDTMSLTRYLSVSFPHFILLGILGRKQKYWDLFATLSFILLTALFSIAFFNWYWIG